tara:strand:- start:145 stop:252 length:108 start_codon:yes stop_codon:yes gene_type:complete
LIQIQQTAQDGHKFDWNKAKEAALRKGKAALEAAK